MITEQEFNLRPSPIDLVMLGFFTSLNIIAIAFLPLSLWIKSLLTILFIFYEISFLWKYGLFKGQSLIKQLIYRQTHWLVKTPNNNWVVAELVGDSTVTWFVSILHFRLHNQKQYYCLIWRDSLPKDVYRCLLLAIKWGYH